MNLCKDCKKNEAIDSQCGPCRFMEFKTHYIKQGLEKFDGQVKMTAKYLGMSHTTVSNFIYSRPELEKYRSQVVANRRQPHPLEKVFIDAKKKIPEEFLVSIKNDVNGEKYIQFKKALETYQRSKYFNDLSIDDQKDALKRFENVLIKGYIDELKNV